MDTKELLQFAAQLGVGGLLAAFIFMTYHRAMTKQIEEAKGREEVLIDLVTNNTVAITKNTAVIDELRKDLARGRT